MAFSRVQNQQCNKFSPVCQKVKMKGIPYFLFALLVIFSTTNANSPSRLPRRTCNIKYKGVATKVHNVPKKCCSKNGKLNMKMSNVGTRSSICEPYVCPLLMMLKGCNFMCNFYKCNLNYGGEANCRDLCGISQPKTPTTTTKPSTASTNITTTKPKPTPDKNNVCPVITSVFGCKFVCSNQKVKKCRKYYGGKNNCLAQCKKKTSVAPQTSTPKQPTTTKPSIPTSKPSIAASKSTEKSSSKTTSESVKSNTKTTTKTTKSKTTKATKPKTTVKPKNLKTKL